jgi:hypothetical protein
VLALDQRRAHSCLSECLAQWISTLAGSDNDCLVFIERTHGTLLTVLSILFEQDAHSNLLGLTPARYS